jgi:hypothetical protein
MGTGRLLLRRFDPPVARLLGTMLACSHIVTHGRVMLDRLRSSVLLV